MHPMLTPLVGRRQPSPYTEGTMLPWAPRAKRWQWALAVFLLLLGFLLVLQFRTSRAIRSEVELPTMRVRELAVLVEQLQAALQALQAEVSQLRSKLSEYELAAAQGRSSAETLAREVEFYQMVLGLIPVRGPGVVVRLRLQPVPGGLVTGFLHPSDLSGLANELWSAGAEAIAVNGKRILATTGFRSAGEQTIVVGIHRMSPPFEITAIGSPQAMKATLNLRGGFVEGLRSVGLEVEIIEQPVLVVPAYTGPLRFRYAAPAQP